MKKLRTSIKDELGNDVAMDYLVDTFKISNGLEDFINKVNYGITDEKTFVSSENNRLITDLFTLLNNL